MSWRKLYSLRSATGRLAGILLGMVLLCLADGLVGEARHPFNEFHLLPGETLTLNGPLPAEAESLADLRIDGVDPEVSLSLKETYKGFWYGGLMWNAELSAAPSARPGRRVLSLKSPREKAQNPLLVYAVEVFPDRAARRAAASTYVMRWFGASPFLVAALVLPLGLIAGGASFIAAGKLSRAMSREGRAEIYMLKKTPEGCHISAGLGTDHGLSEGARLTILDPGGIPVGSAEVLTCTERDCLALVSPDCPAKLGYFLAVEA
jgi:hypothetical protein